MIERALYRLSRFLFGDRVESELIDLQRKCSILMDRIDALELAEADRQHREAGRAVVFRPEIKPPPPSSRGSLVRDQPSTPFTVSDVDHE